MWERCVTVWLWLVRNRRIESLAAQIDLLKTRLNVIEGELTDLRRVLDEERSAHKRCKDDLGYCERERQRLYRENHDLLTENRTLRNK